MIIKISGNGAGAHALAWKLAQSRQCQKIICMPGNAGTQTLCDPINMLNTTADIEIPKTKLLYQIPFRSSNRNYIDVCMFRDGKSEQYFPPIHVAADDEFLSCTMNSNLYDSDIYHAVLPMYKSYCLEPGIYTFRFSDLPLRLSYIYKGLPDATACIVLPSLQGDIIQILQMMASGFSQDFHLHWKDGCVTAFCFTGQIGDRLENLAELPGDIGVFLHQMENVNGILRFTGPHGLYLCAREQSELLAHKKAKDAHKLLKSLPK